MIVKPGRTLYDSDDLVRKNGGEPTMSITQVQKAADKINNGEPDKPLDVPGGIPDPWGEERMNLKRVKK